ncbi:MAG: hypothetical protein GWP10_08910 [Nitrospiraceae bacterium]|nr:hypothetical protein [Nitrospiraceae bacterium]
MFNLNKLIPTIMAFVLLCFTAGSGYIFNDIVDAEKDKWHPVKQKRPIASGIIPPKKAFAFGSLLFISVLLVSFFTNVKLSLVLFLYGLNVVWYSLFFKRIAYIDIFFIAFAFELRLFAGGIAAGVHVSKWLFILTFSVAMMLACGKRLEEINSENKNFRSALKFYNKTFLDAELVVFAALSLLLFFYYLRVRSVHNVLLHIVSFILIANYVYNAFRKHLGEPTEFILKNKLNFIMLALWALLFFKEIYL